MITKDQLNHDILDSDSNYSLCQCGYCKDIFHSIRPNKYCSNSCRQKAYYVRNGLRRDTRKDNLSTNFSSSTGATLDVYKAKKSISVSQNNNPENPKRSSSVSAKNAEEKIKKLEQLLANSTLKAIALEEMILVAEEYFNIPIRKKRGAKQ